MKRKSRLCSTGHGTGVMHRADLRVILARKQPRRYRLHPKDVPNILHERRLSRRGQAHLKLPDNPSGELLAKARALLALGIASA